MLYSQTVLWQYSGIEKDFIGWAHAEGRAGCTALDANILAFIVIHHALSHMNTLISRQSAQKPGCQCRAK